MMTRIKYAYLKRKEVAFRMGTAAFREAKVFRREGLMVGHSEEHTRNMQGLEKLLSI